MHKNFNSQNYGHGPGVDAGYLKKKKKKKKIYKKILDNLDFWLLLWPSLLFLGFYFSGVQFVQGSQT
jgi:hypothetical protein